MGAEQHDGLLMGAMLRQLGGQVVSAEPGSAGMTLVRGSRPVVVVPEMTGTQEKQARPGALAPQGARANETASAASPGSLGAEEAGELVKRSQMLEEALRGVLATGTSHTGYLQAKDHNEVVGTINSGSQMAHVSK